MYKCGLMVMVVTGLIVCPHHTIITLVYNHHHCSSRHHTLSTDHLYINIVTDVSLVSIKKISTHIYVLDRYVYLCIRYVLDR